MNQIARIPSSLLASSHYRGYPVQFLIPFSPERWDELLFFLLPPKVARDLLLKLIERYGMDHTPYHECVVVHFRKAHRERARNVLREVCGRDWAQCELPVWDGDTEEHEKACVQAWEGGEETAQDRTEQSGFEMKEGEWVELEFYGQTLEAIQKDGKVWVSVKRVCDNLGVDRKAQMDKINEHPVFSEGRGLIPLPSGGGLQETLCLELGYVMAWLVTIHPNRVGRNLSPDKKKTLKRELELYQKEAVKALESHFWGSHQSTPCQKQAIHTPQPKALPLPDVPEKSTRALLSQLVWEHYDKTGVEYQVTWRNIYREFLLRHKINLRRRSDNRGMKPLDYAEREGMLEALYATARKLLLAD